MLRVVAVFRQLAALRAARGAQVEGDEGAQDAGEADADSADPLDLIGVGVRAVPGDQLPDM